MTETQRMKLLQIALVMTGVVTIALYPLMLLWPSGWVWHAGYSPYAMMLVGIYATLGVFLIRAARDPLGNLSLIWFTVWSSLVHGGIMTAQALASVEHRGHLLGDVPALFFAAAVLAVLAPRGQKAGAS